MELILLKNVTKSYATKQNKNAFTLTNINLSFPNRGMVFIRGKSGSGKSTILNIISLLEKIDKGKVVFNGKDISTLRGKDKEKYLRNDISLIFQHYNLFDELSAKDNIYVSAEIAGVKQKDIKHRVKELSKKFNVSKLLDKKTKYLSGGEKQRIAIIRALVKHPKAILCDEPTGALDTTNSKITMDILKDISKDILVIVVSHNEELINEYADEIITIKDGRVESKEIINEIKGSKTSKDKKGLPKSKYVNKFIGVHLKENMLKNIMMIISSLIGFIFLLLSIGFDHGSKKSIEEYQNKNLSAFHCSLQNKDYEDIEDSIISVVKLSRPNELELEVIKDKLDNYIIQYDFSYLLPQYINLFINNEYKEPVEFIPIYDQSLLSLDKKMLLEGDLSFNNSFDYFIVNKEFKDKYSLDNLSFKIDVDIDYPVIDIDRSFVKDKFVLEKDINISGVIKEFSFMNHPKIYYSYLSSYRYLSNHLLTNISDYLEESFTALDLVVNSKDESIFSGYAYNLFLLEDEIKASFKLSDELDKDKSRLVLYSSAKELINAYEELTTSFISSMYMFVIISLLGVIFILGITTYSSFVKYKKERAVLSVLGSKGDDILDIFLIESTLISLLSSVVAIILSSIFQKLFSQLFYLKFNVENLIDIPYMSYLNIPFFPIIAVILLSMVVSFCSTYFPYLVFKKNKLVDELKDL